MQRSFSDNIFLSVVVPVFNEENKIDKDLVQIYDYFNKQDYTFEVIVVDDGSEDKTCKLLKSWEAKYQNFKCLHYTQNKGKGFAVREGMLKAKGDFSLFIDAGSCVPLEETEKGISLLLDGGDAAFGSRASAGSKIIQKQPLYRRMGAWLFALTVKWFMGVDGIKDTQCGFKMFKRHAAHQIFKRNKTEGFMFDIETILNARKMGLQVMEFPITWKNDPDTRFRFLSGSLRNLRELLKIKFRKP
ncbi:MAG: glycosyltransferase family 2 protein [Candidatus Aminicenantes bacterium]|nr:glycosyltransferase family 2 protein [Candidatus Aminicenantes bacterium]